MRIKSLTLQDIGLFRGRQTLDLTPRKKYGVGRPVVLIGGHNGAGKTTILGGLQLALYGRLALGPRVTDREYQDHLRGLIHRRKDTLIPISAACVSVEFEHARAGTRSTYTVQRSWQARGERIEEQLSVLRDGTPLPDVEAELWPDFVRALVPHGLSQLFFFDGEKIQRLAEAETESEALGESIKALLGLDLVERLEADLDILMERRARAGNAGKRGKRLEEIEERTGVLAKEDAVLQKREAQLRSQLDGLFSQSEKLERRLSASGRELGAKRETLRSKATEARGKLEALERQMRDLCEEALPFALCPALCALVTRQLDAESEAEQWVSTRSELEAVRERVKDRLRKRSSRVERTAREGVLAEVEAVFNEVIAGKSTASAVPRIHDASEAGRGFLRQVLGARQADAARRLAELHGEATVLEAKLGTLQKRLNAVPDDDEVKPILRSLSDSQIKQGELSEQLKNVTDARGRIAGEREKLERDRKKILEAQADSEKSDAQLALAGKARQALGLYLERLTRAKVERLEGEALLCFKQLCRKEDLIEAMSIDPVTFRVTLRDKRGRELPKSDLSAGEKQLYAVALLWALARVSGRPLPMIVDTPLGRLDSVHRGNLVERYFPHASHQVIILSTDTEVDQACASALRASTSHALRLTHHHAEGWTEVQDGYFWRSEKVDGHAVAHA